MKKALFPILMIITLFPGYAQDKPQKTSDALFIFIVTSKSGEPRQGEYLMIKSFKTHKVYDGTTSSDGKCSVLIPAADKYSVYYKHLSDTVKYTDIEVPGGERRLTYSLTLRYDPPKVFTLKNVFFETGLSTLRKESYPALNELVAGLKAKPGLVIEIAGHTDNVGKPESNQKLSEDRANAVRDYLMKHGIEEKRVTAKGYGDTQPVASNATPQGRQENRRTEVRIISE